MTAFMRPIFIKDIGGTKIRVSIWRPPYKMAMEFITGKVYSFKYLQTDNYPDEKPHNLKSGYHTAIKVCTEDVEKKFSNVPDWDGCFEGIYIFIFILFKNTFLKLLQNMFNYYVCIYF